MCRATWGPRLFNTHAASELRRSARRYSSPCRAFALPNGQVRRGPGYSILTAQINCAVRVRRYSSPFRAFALPMCRATWGPRLSDTHGTNKLRRSVRRHSPPCRAFALPMRRATWGPRLFNTHGTNKLRRSGTAALAAVSSPGSLPVIYRPYCARNDTRSFPTHKI